MSSTDEMRRGANAAKQEALGAMFAGEPISEEAAHSLEQRRRDRLAAAAADREYVEQHDVIECIELLAAHLVVGRPSGQRILPFVVECATDTLRHRGEAPEGSAVAGPADVCNEVYDHDVRGATVMEAALPTVAAPHPGPDGPVVLFAPPRRGVLVDAARLALSCAGVPHRAAWVGWQRFREQGLRLPVLTVDGPASARRVVSERSAVLRYAAQVAGLYPEDPLKAAVADSVVCRLEDMRVDELLFEDDDAGGQLRDEAAVGAALDENLELAWAAALQQLCELRRVQGHKGRFLLGDAVCHADAAVYCSVTLLNEVVKKYGRRSVYGQVMAMKPWVDAVAALPQVQGFRRQLAAHHSGELAWGESAQYD